MRRKHAQREGISGARKALFYLGTGLEVVGLVCAGAFIVLAWQGFHKASAPGVGLDLSSRSAQAAGMVMLGLGTLLRHVGARGLAGGGLVLDPQRARKDLQPYAHLAGGLLADAAEELGVAPAQTDVVKIRCGACKGLNPEAQDFCGHCGAKL